MKCIDCGRKIDRCLEASYNGKCVECFSTSLGKAGIEIGREHINAKELNRLSLGAMI